MKIDITHIAKLANLPLTTKELTKFGNQMKETIEYVDKLAEIDTNNVLPTAHVTGLENITREDVAQDSLTQQQALANTHSTHEGYISVAKILDTD